MKKLIPYLLSLLGLILLVLACGKDDEPNTPPVTANNSPTIEAQSMAPNENIAPGTNIGSVTALDEDGDTLSFSLTGDGPFVISSAGVVSLAEVGVLDFETIKTYALTVTVEDASASASATLTIEVQDINEPPSFDEPSFMFDALENVVVAQALGQVKASDPEGAELEFAIVENDNELFAIDPKTGEISVAPDKMLDFESFADANAVHTITVSISDGENPVVTISVTISVTDVDEDPTFYKDAYEFEVAENSTTVGSVEVIDPQESKLDLVLTGGPDGLFTMDENGAITVAEGQVLDFEEEPNEYELTVTATDPEGNTGHVPVNIIVTPVDEVPVLEVNAETEFTSDENVAEDYVIGTLLASDPEGGNLSFEILGNNTLFEIDANGNISLIDGQILDFEAFDGDDPVNIFVVRVRDINQNFLDLQVRITVSNVIETLAEDLNSFVTKWEVTEVNEEIVIGIDSDFNYSFTIDWGDGTENDFVLNGQNSISHLYEDKGEYIVAIQGDFPAIIAENGHRLKLLSIERWGSIQWQTMSHAFSGCINMVCNATDVPNLTEVFNMERMFRGATIFQGNLSDWNTENVINMESMFWGTKSFNNDISSWNTGNVENMSSMFEFSVFNQNIGEWDTSKVIDMSHMFSFSYFNQNIGSWNIQNVENMTGMLSTASLFSIQNYSATLIGWATLDFNENQIPVGISLDAYPYVCADSDAEQARQSLIDDYGWDISDEGILVCED